jgi:hypothetical protein
VRVGRLMATAQPRPPDRTPLPSHPLPHAHWTTTGRPRQPRADARHPHTVLLRVAQLNPSLPSSFLRVVPPAPDPRHLLLSSSSVPRDRKRASTAPAIPFPVSTPPRDRAHPCTLENSLRLFPGAGTLPPRRISSKPRRRPRPPVRATSSPSTLEWPHPSSPSILP